MDFTFTEERETISKLARDLRYDAALRKKLAAVDLLGSAEAGARAAATAQRVHGGIGIDVTYRLHRYFLWAKHRELALGPASQQLACLGSTCPEGR